MKAQHVPARDMIREMPRPAKLIAGVLLSAIASYYVTHLVLIGLGEPTTPLLDPIGLGINSVLLIMVSTVGISIKRVAQVNLVAASLGFVYIVFMLRFASRFDAGLIRQYLFYTLPYLVNAFLLIKWLRFSGADE